MTARTMTAKGDILIVGAGLSGAVVARELAEAGHGVRVIDQRPHVAGNCHTERDRETGVLVHVYGPHIFHTDHAEVWDYANRFERFRPFKNQVKARVGDRIYSLPINLLTINQFFGKALRPDEARAFVEAQADHAIIDPITLEDQALRFVGPALYEAFFKGYTQKQWGCEPRDLPASVLKRLPLRFDYNDDYYTHRFQGMPEGGYTSMVSRILNHPGISLSLNTAFEPALAANARHVFWSGALDGWFGHDLGHLGYRSLRFERFTHRGDWQGCAGMNYCDADVPYTRVTEHKHFAPWEEHSDSVLYREYACAHRPGDIPFYPVRQVADKALLARYVDRARNEKGVTFLGRLGTYRYLDMDVTIREALDPARQYLRSGTAHADMPAFTISPL